MAFEPNGNWQAGQEYPAEQLNALEAAAKAGEDAHAALSSKADVSALDAKADASALDAEADQSDLTALQTTMEDVLGRLTSLET